MRVFKAVGIVFVVGFWCAACTVSDPRWTTIDQVPMYGGMDRSAHPTLKAADEKLIAGVTRAFGTRETASDRFVDQGIRFYHRGDYQTAMKRFNQAWLLNPKNPKAFWGFAIVRHDQGAYGGAKKWIDQALKLGLTNPVALADAGMLYSTVAEDDESLTEQQRSILTEKSKQLYTQAISLAPGNDYIYSSWAHTLYRQGDYEGAREMVNKQRQVGGTPNAWLMNRLDEKVPEGEIPESVAP